MRIISTFKDYYDIGQAYGADPSLVYARETREATVESTRLVRGSAWDSVDGWLDRYRYQPQYGNRNYPDHTGLMPRVVGFCGRLYPLFLQSDIGSDRRSDCLYYTADDSAADESGGTGDEETAHKIASLGMAVTKRAPQRRA